MQNGKLGGGHEWQTGIGPIAYLQRSLCNSYRIRTSRGAPYNAHITTYLLIYNYTRAAFLIGGGVPHSRRNTQIRDFSRFLPSCYFIKGDTAA